MVLLVEDDDIVARLIVHILARVRRRVVRARDGAECLRLFAAHAPEIGLAILDCRLPDTEGARLCEELRRRAPGLPVLLTSGRDHAREAEAAEMGGATAFLAKPFRPVDVEGKVAALFDATA